MLLEVCANSFTSAKAAEAGGAHRAELCDNLAEGGTTPSYGQILKCVRELTIDIFPIIRPRGGDFVYSDDEFDIMKEDIKLCRDAGCEGVVFGILTSGGKVDTNRCKELISLARPMQVTFHRAFDSASNLPDALEAIISLNMDRVLTSGGAEKAIDAMDVIGKLVKQANGRIIIMPGSGIDEHNLAALIQNTGADEYHASAKEAVIYNKRDQGTASIYAGSINTYEATSAQRVNNLVSILKSHS